jgi:phage-related tail fiber protein
MYAGSTAPNGWLECNGQSTSGFADLAAIVGNNVPDLRGEFVRGWDNGRGIDSGRSIRSFQNEAFKAHSHDYIRGQGGPGNSVTGGPSQINDGVSNRVTSNAGGDETRPRNRALMFIIKT